MESAPNTIRFSKFVSTEQQMQEEKEEEEKEKEKKKENIRDRLVSD